MKDIEAANPAAPTATSLGTFEIFYGLSHEDRIAVAPLMKTLKVKRGARIISTTQQTNDVYFIIGGKVRACAFSKQGKQIYFEDLGPGIMFGELAAIDEGERGNDCIAVEDSLLAVLPACKFKEIVSHYPSVQEALLKRLVGLVRRQMQRVYEFSSFNVNQRLRFELLRLASSVETTSNFIELERPPTHTDIAARISSHREAVSRELKKLESAGVITWRPGEYVIHDVNELARLAAS